MSTQQALRRFIVLTFLRWFPTGMWIPVGILLPLDRGLALPEIGLAMAMQGFVVLALELPTGGLADSWGRRPVLLVAGAVGLASLSLVYFAHTMAMFMVAYLLQGIYRALDSGPLEAWYVDAALAADPRARLEKGLSLGTAGLGVGIALGALTTGGLITWVRVPGIETLALPLIIALGVMAAGFVAVGLLVQEPSRQRSSASASVRGLPRVIADGVRLVRRSRVLAALIAVELFWGFGMVTFESLMPIRLAEVAGGTEPAAAIMGPASSAGWLVSAAGAALIPLVSSKFGVANTAAAMRVLQGVAVIGMGVLAGPAGVLTGFLFAYVLHGAANPLHTTLLHREVGAGQRATVLSLNSMVGQPAGSLGLIALTGLAGATSVTFAIVVGGVVLAVAAPMYFPARRAERRRQSAASEEDVGSTGALTP